MLKKINSIAPTFILPNQLGDMCSLQDLIDDFLILYFYPKDDTPGCTKEACAFQDKLSEFKQHNVAVVGVSADSEESHMNFKSKYGLDFTLLSDVQKTVHSLYGITDKSQSRTTYLIDKKGVIQRVYDEIDVLKHPEQVLDDIKALNTNNG